MELLLANLAGALPRRVTEDGREYLVAPMTLIIPGVLNGSQGALYYPPDEIQASVKAWNGVPITLRHPRKDGNLVPASKGGTRLGEVRNAGYQDKLTAEGWFPVELLNKESPQLLRSMETGLHTELSTGLYTDNIPARNEEYKGRKYTHVARNYRPDHLAILPDEKGACSIDDGCGVNVNEEAGTVKKLAGLFRETADTLSELFSGNVQPHSKNTGRFKRPGAGMGKGEAHSYAQAGHAQASITDRQRSLGTDAQMQAEAGHNPASWVGDEATWERAKEAAEKSGQGDNYALITYIYENMGGTILSGNEQAFNDREGEMPLTREQRQKLIDNLLGCCWEKEDQPVLEKLTDNQLVRMDKQHHETEELTLVANAAREAFKLPGTLKTNEMPAAIKEKIAAKEEEDMTDEEKKKAEEEKKKAEEEKAAAAKAENKAAVLPKWEDLVPADVKEDIAFARNERARQKRELITRITDNMEEGKRKEAEAVYNKLSVPELELLVPPAKQRRTDNYAPAPLENGGGQGEVPLGQPTWNFSPTK